jgi:hypothetical protein
MNVIHHLLDDAFLLTLDKLCNPITLAKDKDVPSSVYSFLSEFNVPGYDDDQNLWFRMFKLINLGIILEALIDRNENLHQIESFINQINFHNINHFYQH